MNLTLQLVRETEKARLYRKADGSQQWVPRSVCERTLKFPAKTPESLPLHEVAIADWWLEKNPWPAAQKELI